MTPENVACTVCFEVLLGRSSNSESIGEPKNNTGIAVQSQRWWLLEYIQRSIASRVFSFRIQRDQPLLRPRKLAQLAP